VKTFLDKNNVHIILNEDEAKRLFSEVDEKVELYNETKTKNDQFIFMEDLQKELITVIHQKIQQTEKMNERFEIETNDIEEAEKLQKSGWLLLSIKVVGNDKEGFTLKKYTLKKQEDSDGLQR